MAHLFKPFLDIPVYRAGLRGGPKGPGYINELATLFDNTDADPFILPNGSKLTCLLYADDLILLSRSKFGLQKSLDDLHRWSKNWLMEINLKKTQIMIIEKRKTRKASPTFNRGNRNIAIVQEYCYLGVKLNHNGNFTLALKQLSEKALHALFGMRRQLNFSHLNPKYAIKIFDSIISPILLYNSEIWGMYVKNDFNNWDKLPIEKVHLNFCKIYLAISRKASNIASRAELGKLPLIINVFKRVFKYITHLNSLPETTIAKQAFLISKDLCLQQKISFYGNAMDTIKNLNLNEEIPILETITTKTLEEKYLTFWKHKLENSSKLTFYSTFKTDHKLEKYLEVIKDPYKRKCLSRFRVSNHSLQIEIGRYQKIPREERLCPICNSGEVESETHLLLSCKAYEHSRENLRSSFENGIRLNPQPLSADIMKSTDSEIITKLSKFVYSCFEQRLKYLEIGNDRQKNKCGARGPPYNTPGRPKPKLHISG